MPMPPPKTATSATLPMISGRAREPEDSSSSVVAEPSASASDLVLTEELVSSEFVEVSSEVPLVSVTDPSEETPVSVVPVSVGVSESCESEVVSVFVFVEVEVEVEVPVEVLGPPEDSSS